MGKEVKSLGLSSFDGTSLTVNYQVINATGFSHSVNQLHIANSSDLDCYLSFDGTNPQEYILADTSRTINFITDSTANLHAFKKGLKVYVKSSGAAQGGAITVTGYSVNY